MCEVLAGNFRVLRIRDEKSSGACSIGCSFPMLAAVARHHSAAFAALSPLCRCGYRKFNKRAFRRASIGASELRIPAEHRSAFDGCRVLAVVDCHNLPRGNCPLGCFKFDSCAAVRFRSEKRPNQVVAVAHAGENFARGFYRLVYPGSRLSCTNSGLEGSRNL